MKILQIENSGDTCYKMLKIQVLYALKFMKLEFLLKMNTDSIEKWILFHMRKKITINCIFRKANKYRKLHKIIRLIIN